jgi:glycosyltransferase involved in cell wall biosynthesis
MESRKEKGDFGRFTSRAKLGITCIVPARNESGHLREVVEGIISLNSVSEIIIVEGGSSDDTWAVAKSIEAKKLFALRAIKQDGSGKFSAVASAAKLAEYSHVIIWDADGTVSLRDTKKLLEFFRVGASLDAVMGNRLAGEIHPGAMQRANWIGNWLFALLWWPILGLKYPSDLLCGTKIFPTEIFKRIPSWLNAIDPYGDFAIIATCRRYKVKIHSLSVDYFPRTYGSTNIKRWSGGLRLLLTSIIAFAWIVMRRRIKKRSQVSNLNYADQLRIQRKNSSIPSVQVYLKSLYGRVENEIKLDAEYLEIGAGAGISKDFLKEYRIQRTDFMSSEHEEIRGGVDAHALPYKNDEFDGVLLFDALHHFEMPLSAMKECLRVTKPGGKIILIEPYVSLFSYPIYKFFHFEKTSWTYRFDRLDGAQSGPEQGDQGISKAILKSLKYSKTQKLKGFSSWNYSLITPFSFFLTGGATSPLKIPSSVIKFAIMIENRIPKNLMRFIAARIFMVFRK